MNSTSSRRQTGVVKEVEKMAVARDKKREQQTTVVEEQGFRAKDPTKPNREFQAMIDDFKEDLEVQPLVDGNPVY